MPAIATRRQASSEPFGLAMIESMACGTPVIAFNRGSVPEIDECLTGFVVEDEEAAVRGVGPLAGLDRALVRRQFERRFAVRQMATEYVALYRRMVFGSQPDQQLVHLAGSLNALGSVSGHERFPLHGPAEGFRHGGIEVGDETLDPLLKMFLRCEIAAPEKLPDQDREPDFDLVDPGRVLRREVERDAMARFDTADLARMPVVVLAFMAPGNLQGLGPTLSHAISGALAEVRPPIREISTDETLNQLTDKGLATEYADMRAGFARNGMLDRAAAATDWIGTWLTIRAAARGCRVQRRDTR